MKDMTPGVLKDMLLVLLYFGASTAITWWFIVAGRTLYADEDRMLLSCAIAGAKWALQIGVALAFLHADKRWPFLRRIGSVCLAGSCVLIPFCCPAVQRALGQEGFLGSLIFCVLLMIVLYYRSVRRSGLSPKWFWGWMLCLAGAITLQLTVVFR